MHGYNSNLATSLSKASGASIRAANTPTKGSVGAVESSGSVAKVDTQAPTKEFRTRYEKEFLDTFYTSN